MIIFGCVLSGCSTIEIFRSRTKHLSPQDTIASRSDEDDEFFINNKSCLVAYGFDDEKTEYNYTLADILGSTYFEFDSSKLSQLEKNRIKHIANALLKDKSIEVLVVGNCDRFGKESYNYTLGEKRANSVRDVLVDCKIQIDRITTASLGSTKSNKLTESKADSASDRRCDVVLRKFKR